MKSDNSRSREYRPRVIDSSVQELLQISGAVVLEGPRACGKTSTALEHANTAHFLDARETRALAELSPGMLLEGEPPILLDEWQLDPPLWNEVRRSVDVSGAPGRFILTGSSVPSDDATRHTGAGRFVRLRMRTMTWQERGVGHPGVSLRALSEGEPVAPSQIKMEYPQVVNALLTSGFPAQIGFEPKAARRLLDAYLTEITHTDVFRLEQLNTEPRVIEHLIRSLARNTASEVTYETLAKDARVLAPTLSAETVSKIVALLERLFVVERVPAFSARLRSKARLRRSPKFHLMDPAFAAAALRATSEDLAKDPLTAGFLFESAVIHDLLVYAQALGAEVWHYRNSYGQEIDAILTFPDGGWAGVEIKLGASQIASGAKSLRDAAASIDAGEPKFLAVITGTGITADLGDGMVTFPLAALGA
ncbi:MAG: DUF4143 domain-containing protein [Actinomycetaceae bacterium]|nr:DUF4143 domain-containing protein [Actinomycetaceae bacterium]